MAPRVWISALSMGPGSSSRGSGERLQKRPLDGDLEQEKSRTACPCGMLFIDSPLDETWKWAETGVPINCDYCSEGDCTVSAGWWGPVKNYIWKTLIQGNARETRVGFAGTRWLKFPLNSEFMILWNKNYGKSGKNLFKACIRYQFDYVPLHGLSHFCRPSQARLTLVPELYILPQWKQTTRRIGNIPQ